MPNPKIKYKIRDKFDDGSVVFYVDETGHNYKAALPSDFDKPSNSKFGSFLFGDLLIESANKSSFVQIQNCYVPSIDDLELMYRNLYKFYLDGFSSDSYGFSSNKYVSSTRKTSLGFRQGMGKNFFDGKDFLFSDSHDHTMDLQMEKIMNLKLRLIYSYPPAPKGSLHPPIPR